MTKKEYRHLQEKDDLIDNLRLDLKGADDNVTFHIAKCNSAEQEIIEWRNRYKEEKGIVYSYFLEVEKLKTEMKRLEGLLKEARRVKPKTIQEIIGDIEHASAHQMAIDILNAFGPRKEA